MHDFANPADSSFARRRGRLGCSCRRISRCFFRDVQAHDLQRAITTCVNVVRTGTMPAVAPGSSSRAARLAGLDRVAAGL